MLVVGRDESKWLINPGVDCKNIGSPCCHLEVSQWRHSWICRVKWKDTIKGLRSRFNSCKLVKPITSLTQEKNISLFIDQRLFQTKMMVYLYWKECKTKESDKSNNVNHKLYPWILSQIFNFIRILMMLIKWWVQQTCFYCNLEEFL